LFDIWLRFYHFNHRTTVKERFEEFHTFGFRSVEKGRDQDYRNMRAWGTSNPHCKCRVCRRSFPEFFHGRKDTGDFVCCEDDNTRPNVNFLIVALKSEFGCDTKIGTSPIRSSDRARRNIPRRAQRRSAFSSALALTISPDARTTSISNTLSIANL
jgi:hypothetical protein